MRDPEPVQGPTPDWRAELRKQERSILWLARQTQAGRTTVYRYAWGHRTPSPDWVKRASRALGMGD